MSQPELLRHVNQEIENLWLARLRPEDELPVICECADRTCTAVVKASLETFRDAVDSGLFLVLPGHHIPGCVCVRAGESWELLELAGKS